jgi:hypothetical protein
MPDVHTCSMCAGLILVTSVNGDTETKTFQAWKKFASPQSLALLNSVDGLKAFLCSQLKSMNPFLTTTVRKLRSRATKGCLLAAYILRKSAKPIDSMKGGELYLEPNDPFHPFHIRANHLGGDLSSIFGAECEVQTGSPERRESWPNSVYQERLFICTEPKPDIRPAEGPPGEWRFRWFIEPYRPFHPLHFEADDGEDEGHIADDGNRIDLFQIITLRESGYRRLPRIFEYDPGCDRALLSIRAYIDSITLDRTEAQDSFKPSRLISFDVSKSRSHAYVKLVNRGIVPDASGYAALSYCWGGDQKLKLTKDTYDQFHQNIRFESLPRTLQDAVIVASTFGIPYLWIDALCIIQDDEIDIGRELTAMAQVYLNASLTISASRAKSVEEGFLQPRLPFKDSASVSFGLTLLEPETRRIVPIICFPAADLIGYEATYAKSGDMAHEGSPSDPVISRAWCFQERALSNCLVEFGVLSTRVRINQERVPQISHSDSWKIDEKHKIPFSSSAVEVVFHDKDYEPCEVLFPNNNTSIFFPIESNTPPGMRGLYIYWCSTLTYFSTLDLSVLKDRLPAFSSIVSRFAPFFGGKQNYVAGIWKDTLPLGLLWAVRSEDETKDDVLHEYVAPTWSWASIRSTVTYDTSMVNNSPKWDFVNNLLTKGLELNQGLEVLDCNVDLDNEQVSFGAVSCGQLRLRGRLRPVYLCLEKSLARPIASMDPRGRIQTRMQIAMSHTSAEPDFDKQRGLHRRDYQHPNAAFRGHRLLVMPTIDRTEDAFETMVAAADGQLFAVPVASEPHAEREEGPHEEIWSIELPKVPNIYGLLVLRQADGTYIRMGIFWQYYIPSSMFGDYRLEVQQIPALIEDQYQWMLGGEPEEFVLV